MAHNALLERKYHFEKMALSLAFQDSIIGLLAVAEIQVNFRAFRIFFLNFHTFSLWNSKNIESENP